MHTSSKALRGLIGGHAVAMSMILASCAPPEREEGLYFQPPKSTGGSAVSTSLAPTEVAQALRDAGFGNVRAVGDDIVLLKSNDLRLVDCGTLIQVSKGNEAEFPGNAPKSVLIEGFVTPGLIQRGIRSVSEVRLTRQSDGSGYAIDEKHVVTRDFAAVSSRARSTASITFDEVGAASFADRTSCRSSGLIATTLR
jgi:hypothetical protein